MCDEKEKHIGNVIQVENRANIAGRIKSAQPQLGNPFLHSSSQLDVDAAILFSAAV